MRTTVELPPELLREAKIHAAHRGESLKSLLTRAVAAELGRSAETSTGRQRHQALPVFGDPSGTRVNPPGEDLEQILAQDDAQAARTRAPQS